MIRAITASLATAVALVLAGPASAATPVSQETPNADACTKNVDAMGASMGHTTETAPDGRSVLRFVLRTNGLDYEVVCDPKTGILGDITPRASH
ncbi:MAG: hypothetical protein K2Y42_10710 [Hyphomicrobium sp.]|jgi:hypothetical protein|uniref:hypothetical protein n=1 Tax=Hyphomicrobium sp. TaxID=82 RepID=UPI0025BBB865|nr:hypothetical protein [Hyphomicrobium sp.]MBX9863211.1 hypothetical protein [Hyphomicrobium sp.]